MLSHVRVVLWLLVQVINAVTLHDRVLVMQCTKCPYDLVLYTQTSLKVLFSVFFMQRVLIMQCFANCAEQ